MKIRDVVIYALALLVAALIIGLGVWFTYETRSAMTAKFLAYKADLRAKKAAGQLSPELRGVDIDRLEQSQVGMQLDSATAMRVDIADFLAEYSFVAGAVVVAVCLVVGIAVNWFWK
jgi:hypothetical protein